MVVMCHPLSNGVLQLPGEVIVFQLNHVLHRTVIAFDLALGHWVVQADTLKEDQAQNTCIFSAEFAVRMMGDIQLPLCIRSSF